MAKGSDLLVAALENEGVKHVFGIRARRTSTSLNRCANPVSNSFSLATSRPPHSWQPLTAD